ncbi:MAG TPA: hypothetical protein VGL72_26685 [Bryobacteraceae bacterium]
MTPKPTKRTAKPHVKVITKPNQKAPAPAVRAARKREFTQIQLSIIDAVSDIVVNGVDDEAMEGLVHATAYHTQRREYLKLYEGRPEKLANLDQDVREALVRHGMLNEWKTDLKIAQRLAKRAPAPERPEPSDVAGKIREAVRNDVQERLDDFMADASPEEMCLMREVLQDRESFHRYRTDDLALALGFNLAMGEFQYVVKVPRRMLKKVENYMEALRAVEGQEVA